jgi:signal transduction histidine kinase
MKEQPQYYDDDIFFAVLAGTILFLILISFLFSYFIIYRKRRKQHQVEIELTKQQFEQELAKTEFEVQEHTRKNIAIDLHDNIGQVLSLTNVTLASINLEEKEKTKQKIADTLELVTRSIRELRQLSKIIHGEQLIKQGLVPTIEQEIGWLQRNGHYTIEFDYSGYDTDIINNDKDLFIYRLLQECLNNIIKHSGADRIAIGLKNGEEHISLTVRDNGQGFNVAETVRRDRGLGLVNMQKRVDLLKGRMTISSVINEGCTVVFIIPYP